MIVVSDTSPVTNLAAIGRLDLLQKLYEKVIIPQAVYRELAHVSDGMQGTTPLQIPEWIECQAVVDRAVVTALQMEVDEGEAEAIALAMELKADFLLLDERHGRAIASRFGLRFIGLLGVVIEAKHRGYIPAVKPIVDDLMVRAGFWVSQQLYARVLQITGEYPK